MTAHEEVIDLQLAAKELAGGLERLTEFEGDALRHSVEEMHALLVEMTRVAALLRARLAEEVAS